MEEIIVRAQSWAPNYSDTIRSELERTHRYDDLARERNLSRRAANPYDRPQIKPQPVSPAANQVLEEIKVTAKLVPAVAKGLNAALLLFQSSKADAPTMDDLWQEWERQITSPEGIEDISSDQYETEFPEDLPDQSTPELEPLPPTVIETAPGIEEVIVTAPIVDPWPGVIIRPGKLPQPRPDINPAERPQGVPYRPIVQFPEMPGMSVTRPADTPIQPITPGNKPLPDVPITVEPLPNGTPQKPPEEQAKDLPDEIPTTSIGIKQGTVQDPGLQIRIKPSPKTKLKEENKKRKNEKKEGVSVGVYRAVLKTISKTFGRVSEYWDFQDILLQNLEATETFDLVTEEGIWTIHRGQTLDDMPLYYQYQALAQLASGEIPLNNVDLDQKQFAIDYVANQAMDAVLGKISGVAGEALVDMGYWGGLPSTPEPPKQTNSGLQKPTIGN